MQEGHLINIINKQKTKNVTVAPAILLTDYKSPHLK